MMKDESIRFFSLTEPDLVFVQEVYNYYILHSTAVYFTDPIPLDEIRAIVPLNDSEYRSFLIKGQTGERLGFCYFARFKEKPAFRISVEVTVYLKPDCLHKGTGTKALLLLEPYIKEGGFSNAVALIDSANEDSIRLFEKCGYTCCAEIKDVAEKSGKKLTLKMYQKLI